MEVVNISLAGDRSPVCGSYCAFLKAVNP